MPTNKENVKINNNANLQPCRYRPFHQWYQHFFDIKNSIHYWSYNSIFSIDHRDILQHPKEKYEKLMEGLEIGNELEEGHYIERAWAAVFHPFVYTQIENLSQNPENW